MFLNPPAETDAVRTLYEKCDKNNGFVMNLYSLWAWRPDVEDAFAKARTLLMEKSSLSSREFAVLICAMAGSLGDSYCALAWGERLAAQSNGTAAAAVLKGVACDTLTPREHALSAWARKVVNSPNDTSPADIELLRKAGFSDKEILEATAFIAMRLAFSTVNDALGAMPDWQLVDKARPEVRDAVAFGRPPGEAPPR
jgi:uncharacterized peroxidase-related enzyme